MNFTSGLKTSNSCEWATPKDFFKSINDEFKFDLDVCATHENAKCEKYFTKEQDGLKQLWSGKVWMNPPYGKEIGKWLEKAVAYCKRGGARCMSSSFKNRHEMVA